MKRCESKKDSENCANKNRTKEREKIEKTRSVKTQRGICDCTNEGRKIKHKLKNQLKMKQFRDVHDCTDVKCIQIFAT